MIKDDSLPKLVRDEVRDKMTQLGTEISTKQNQLQVKLLKKVFCLITLEKIVSYFSMKPYEPHCEKTWPRGYKTLFVLNFNCS